MSIVHALMEKAERAVRYFRIRGSREERGSDVPANVAFAWARGEGEHCRSFDEFLCERTRGHEWAFTGTAYGGDDERWHGEGRCYCKWCGADGDA